MRPRRLEVAGFAVSFALAGVLLAVYLVAGEATYASLAEPAGAVVRIEGAPRRLDQATLVELHRATLAYLFGGESLPDAPGTRTKLFDAAESAHLADVRRVFGGVRLVLAGAILALAWRIVGGARRGAAFLARLARDGATAAAALVGLVAVAAALAFEPLFLAFHLVVFPQGNFLFDPATSNLLALYPEPYWYGVTLRVGLAFVALAALVGLGGAAALRAASVHSPR